VNLTALPRMLSMIWRSRIASPLHQTGRSGSMMAQIVRPFARAATEAVASAASRQSARLKSSH